MINLSLIWLSLPFVLGFLLTYLLIAKRHSPADWLLFILIGMGTGIGLASMTYFAWSLVFSPDYRLSYFYVSELFLAAILAILTWHKWRDGLPEAASEPPGSFSLLLIGLLGIVLFYSVALFIETVQGEPQGNWDAVAIWNFHARFIFLGKAHWLDVFNPLLGLSHPDYPYLLPGFIALCWSILGGIRSNIPPLVGAFFTFGNVILLFSALWRFRGLNQAVLAAIVLLSASDYIQAGGGLVADVPLSFYILVTCILMFLAFQSNKPSPGLLMMIGMTAGFLLWTKNEGMVFVAAFILSWFIAAALKGEFKKSLLEFLLMIGGIAPFLIFMLYYKFVVTPPGDVIPAIVGQGLSSNLAKITSLPRYQEIIRWFGIVLWQMGGWRVPMLLMLIGYALLYGFQKSPSNSRISETRAVWTVGFALAFALVGYLFIYILIPNDSGRHLTSSASRLIRHLFPGAIFLLFYLVNSIPTSHQIFKIEKLRV